MEFFIITSKYFCLGANMSTEQFDIYVCNVCGHEHNEKTDGKFDSLPQFYLCPECGCHKDEYVKV